MPTIRGSDSNDSVLAGSATTITVTFPAGVESGDRAYVVATNLNNAELTMDAAWTPDTQVAIGTAGGRLFRKVCDGSEDSTTVTVTCALGSRLAAALVVVAGANPATEAISVTDNNSTTTLPVPSVTPASDDNVLLAIGAARHQNYAQAGIKTYPAGYTEIEDTATSNGSGQMAGAWAAWKQLGTGTSGSGTGAATVTVNGVDATPTPLGASGATWLLALPNAGDAPPPSAAPTGWDEVRLFTREVIAYDGWDPASNTAPAERSTRAYFDNTGLYLAADQDALTVVPGPSDFATTSANQVIEGMDFVEDVVVNHSGVVFKRCRFRKGIDAGPLGGADVAPVFIYCDAIYNLGGASTSVKNLISGPGKFYRCNISGYVDGVAIKTAADNSGQRSLFMDCFLHDLRLVDDPGQPGRSHNDWFQSNQTGGACDFTHNTIFGSATNNFSAVESWTRSSGPHWTAGETPYSCTFESPSTGGDEVGRINAVIQLKADTASESDLRRNLIAGSMFRVTNATTGNVCRVEDNEVAVAHMDSGNPPFGGTLTTNSGNRDWKSGTPIS